MDFVLCVHANHYGVCGRLQNQKEDPYERMWAFMKINEETSLLNNSINQIIEKVMSGRFALIDDGVTNDYYATQFCGQSVLRAFL